MKKCTFYISILVILLMSTLSIADPKKRSGIDANLLLARSLPDGNGYTWTLTSRLGDILHLAEKIFGPRDPAYTILGVEFEANGPQIWYPGNRRHVIVQLSLSAAADMSQACYQMAHEVVHLLAPSGGANSNNLEEGIACHFSAYYMKEVLKQPNWQPTLPSYKRALEQVAPLVDADINCIRRLRKIQPSLSKMNRQELSQEFPNLSAAQLDFLLAKFDRNAK